MKNQENFTPIQGDNGKLYLKQAETFIKDGRYNKALDFYSTYISNYPQDFETQVKALEIAVKYRQDKTEAYILLHMIKLKPEDISLIMQYAKIAESYIPLGGISAKSAYEKAIALDPKNADAWFGFAKAISRCSGVVQLIYDNWKTKISSNDVHQAFDNAIKYGYNKSEVECTRAGFYYYNQQYNQALASYKTAADAGYKLPLHLAHTRCKDLADKFFNEGQYEQAAQAYNCILQIEENEYKYWKDLIYNNLAECYNALGQHEKAVQSYELALDNHYKPTPNWYKKYGDALYNIQRYNDALNAYQTAKFDDKNIIEAANFKLKIQNLINDGRKVSNDGNFKEAIDIFTKAISEDPSDNLAEFYKGITYARQASESGDVNHINKAIKAFERSIEKGNNSQNCIESLGKALSQLSDKAATNLLNKINEDLHEAPNNLLSHYEKGLILEKLGNINQAIEEFNTVNAIAPDSLYSEIAHEHIQILGQQH